MLSMASYSLIGYMLVLVTERVYVERMSLVADDVFFFALALTIFNLLIHVSLLVFCFVIAYNFHSNVCNECTCNRQYRYSLILQWLWSDSVSCCCLSVVVFILGILVSMNSTCTSCTNNNMEYKLLFIYTLF